MPISTVQASDSMNAVVTRINARDIGLRVQGELPGLKLGMTVDINGSAEREALSRLVVDLTQQFASLRASLDAVSKHVVAANNALR